MAGVDDARGARREVDLREQCRDELVGRGVLRQRCAGPLRLLGQIRPGPAAVAQAPDRQGGQLRRGHAVPHRVGDAQRQGPFADDVVERVATGGVGRHLPARESELRALAAVGGREQPTLDLGFEGQLVAALADLVQVGVPAIGDDDVRQGLRRSGQVVHDGVTGHRGEQELEHTDGLAAFADRYVHPDPVGPPDQLHALLADGGAGGRVLQRDPLRRGPGQARPLALGGASEPDQGLAVDVGDEQADLVGADPAGQLPRQGVHARRRVRGLDGVQQRAQVQARVDPRTGRRRDTHVGFDATGPGSCAHGRSVRRVGVVRGRTTVTAVLQQA